MSDYSITSKIDSGSPINLIKEDCVPNHLREPVVNNDHMYQGVNGLRLNVLNVFRCDCTAKEIL